MSAVARRLKTAITLASAGWMLTACGIESPISSLMPLTSQEYTQLAALRQLKLALSPQNNVGLGQFKRNAGYLMSLGLPTRFGMDLAPYLAPLGGNTQAAAPGGASYDRDPATGEIHRVLTPATGLDFSFHPGDQAFQYAISLVRSPDGSTGNLSATCTGGTWVKQPAAPGAPYLFGGGYTPQTPQDLTLNLSMTQPQTHDQITGSLDLTQFQPNGGGLYPRMVTASAGLPRVTLNLRGQYPSPTSLAMSGTLDVQTDQGAQAWQITSALANQGQGLDVSMLCSDLNLSVTLHVGPGGARGEARSTTEYNRTLATIASAGPPPSPTTIKYKDGSADTWDW